MLVAPGPVTAHHRTARAGRRDAPAREGLVPGLALLAVGAAAGARGGRCRRGVAGAAGLAVIAVLPRWRAHRARPRPDPLGLAGAWDQLAACLRAGLSLDRAARAVVPVLPAAAGEALGRVADLVALGADPAAAWAPALDEPGTARLARAARRSARSGAAVADVVEAVATDLRAEAADAVEARAERAGRDGHRAARPVLPAGVPRPGHRPGGRRARRAAAGAAMSPHVPPGRGTRGEPHDRTDER